MHISWNTKWASLWEVKVCLNNKWHNLAARSHGGSLHINTGFISLKCTSIEMEILICLRGVRRTKGWFTSQTGGSPEWHEISAQLLRMQYSLKLVNCLFLKVFSFKIFLPWLTKNNKPKKERPWKRGTPVILESYLIHLKIGVGLQQFLAITSRHLDWLLLEMGIKCFNFVFTTM